MGIIKKPKTDGKFKILYKKSLGGNAAMNKVEFYKIKQK
jgi:hypothetical protein